MKFCLESTEKSRDKEVLANCVEERTWTHVSDVRNYITQLKSCLDNSWDWCNSFNVLIYLIPWVWYNSCWTFPLNIVFPHCVSCFIYSCTIGWRNLILEFLVTTISKKTQQSCVWHQDVNCVSVFNDITLFLLPIN